MLVKWPVRVKLFIGVGLLLAMVAILSSSGLYTINCYRSLVKNLSGRAVELPLAAELNTRVNELRNTLSELQGIRTGSFPHSGFERYPLRIREQFSTELQQVEATLDDYRDHLEHKFGPDSKIADTQREWETVHKIEAALAAVRNANRDHDWMLDDFKINGLETELENLQQLAAELPSHLHKRLSGFAAEVRGQYHGLFGAALTSSLVAALLFGLFVKLFYQWILVPLRILISGSRRVAGGEFGYRIHLDTHDEMAELAEAMNLMTTRFQSIRDDLDFSAGFYFQWQNNYNFTVSAAGVTTAAACTGTGAFISSAKCAGSQDAVSALLDFRPVKRVDLYAGVMLSNVYGGLANGYWNYRWLYNPATRSLLTTEHAFTQNVSPTAGFRIRF